MRPLGDCSQTLCILIGAGGILQHLVACLFERDQMTGKVSAVDRRDVARLEYAKLVQIVPVEEVSVEPPHSLERAKDLFHTIDHLGPRNEPEVHRADC